jgi:hypothetical protein
MLDKRIHSFSLKRYALFSSCSDLIASSNQLILVFFYIEKAKTRDLFLFVNLCACNDNYLSKDSRRSIRHFLLFSSSYKCFSCSISSNTILLAIVINLFTKNKEKRLSIFFIYFLIFFLLFCY